MVMNKSGFPRAPDDGHRILVLCPHVCTGEKENSKENTVGFYFATAFADRFPGLLFRFSPVPMFLQRHVPIPFLHVSVAVDVEWGQNHTS